MEIPVYYYFIAMLMFLMVYWKTKKLSKSLLIAYMILIFESTVLARQSALTPTIRLSPFWYFQQGMLSERKDLLHQMEANIVMFIPIGFLGSWFIKKPVLLVIISFFFSCLIETSQLILRNGTCEVNDVFNNTIGAFAGWLFYRALCGMRVKSFHINE